jgi:hypothetical protein
MSPLLGDRQTRSLVLRSTAALPRRLRVAARARLLARFDLDRARRAALLIIGHPKSGNTWLRTMLSRLYQNRLGLPADVVVRSDELARANRAAPHLLATNGHYSYEAAVGKALAAGAPDSLLRHKPIVFLARHPCDIVVSWYLQYTRRQSAAKRELINHAISRPIDHRTVSLWEFVMNGDLGLPFLIEYLNIWERNVARLDHAITVRYEDLRAAPTRHLRRIVDLLDPSFTDTEIEDAVSFASFDNLRRLEEARFFRRGGLALRNPHDPAARKVRRGKIHGYRDDLPPEQVAEMDALVAARLSPTLGYGPTDAAALNR